MIDSTSNSQNVLTGAVAALLDEYKRAIEELIVVISPINEEQLQTIVNPESEDPDSRSIQNILSHVVSSCYSYSVYIENHMGSDAIRPDRYVSNEINGYIEKLRAGFNYCKDLFVRYPDILLEEFDNTKKINTRWGQQYDVEQLMEHAIVHILRHRRQIERIINQF